MSGQDTNTAQKNTALRVLLDEAEMSNAGLGRAVVAAGAREGIHLGTDTTSVRRMLDDSQPYWRKLLLGSVFSAAAFAEPALFALAPPWPLNSM
ncbi:MAG: hypothetical protein ACRDTG_21130 [Pseudonocardiaceae bacterium]